MRNKSLKQKILYFRSQGNNYLEISSRLGCSLSTVSYHVQSASKVKTISRKTKARQESKKYFVDLFGGKCQICSYNKCLTALHFHHVHKEDKKFLISDMAVRRHFDKEIIFNELKKCVLVCANCHAEIHTNSKEVSKEILTNLLTKNETLVESSRS
jgi:predicted HNH restriction endonuclease